MLTSPAGPRIRVKRPGLRAVRRRILAVLAVLALAVVGLNAAPAQAATPPLMTPSIASTVSAIDVNGCGAARGFSRYLVPNLWFEEDCNMHDLCYGSGLPRDECDDRFAESMSATCQSNPVCKLLARLYAEAVRRAGEDAYRESTQQRLDDFISQLVACGDDPACEERVRQEQAMDALMNEITACNGDRACEQEVLDRRVPKKDTNDNPPADETGNDETADDPNEQSTSEEEESNPETHEPSNENSPATENPPSNENPPAEDTEGNNSQEPSNENPPAEDNGWDDSDSGWDDSDSGSDWGDSDWGDSGSDWDDWGGGGGGGCGSSDWGGWSDYWAMAPAASNVSAMACF